MVSKTARVELDQDVNLVIRILAGLMEVPIVMKMLSTCGSQVYHASRTFLGPSSRLQASINWFDVLLLPARLTVYWKSLSLGHARTCSHS